jgi:hypothetical protein
MQFFEFCSLFLYISYDSLTSPLRPSFILAHEMREFSSSVFIASPVEHDRDAKRKLEQIGNE